MSILLGHLEGLLGKSHARARDNHAFQCPFCNHHKPKLEVKIVTDEKGENPWECWVCHTKGRTIRSLLRQLKVSREQAAEILSCVVKGDVGNWGESKQVELPKEFKALSESTRESVYANKVRSYLDKRGITDVDIFKYNLGYCDSGPYQGRLIIPSYNEEGRLNYFVARSLEYNPYVKYKNPSTSKNVVIFENLINFNLPIIIVEGVFDAIAAKRNAIPILGTNIQEALLLKLVLNKVEDIYVALDKDAMKHALEYCEEFMDMGMRVFLVDLEDKDPSEMGFEKFTQLIQQAQPLTSGDLLRHKLMSKL